MAEGDYCGSCTQEARIMTLEREVRALGRKQKVSPADLKAVAEKHGKSKANPGKKEK